MYELYEFTRFTHVYICLYEYNTTQCVHAYTYTYVLAL